MSLQRPSVVSRFRYVGRVGVLEVVHLQTCAAAMQQDLGFAGYATPPACILAEVHQGTSACSVA